MTKVCFCLTIFCTSLFCSSAVFAAGNERENSTTQPEYRQWTHTDDQGFTTCLPVLTNSQLLTQVEKLRQQLASEQRELAGFLESNRPTGKDALIVAIMPGGLLYAAYKLNKVQQAKRHLALVDDHLADFGRDLIALETMATERMVAQAQ
jgi:hypothetical protein